MLPKIIYLFISQAIIVKNNVNHHQKTFTLPTIMIFKKWGIVKH